MKDIILKLKDKNIFKIDSLIESEITKSFMGSPVLKKVVLRVKQFDGTNCLADEENALEANVPLRKIAFDKITSIDGMNPAELAAVYGIAPKTERFKKRKEQ
jgi:hypothetical protein